MDIYSLAFSVSNLGPKSYQKLINKFGSAKNAWKGKEEEFAELEIAGLTYKKFDQFRKKFNLEDYQKKLGREKVQFVSYFDKKYPISFKKLENPPIGIYCKGNVGLLNADLKIAVVGTRKITSYGISVTEAIVSGLLSRGVCIVSGLALGVDGLAHKVTLENKGSTIAVMPCGVDCCLPSENFSIYSQILKNKGLIVSEYPLSQSPNKGTFLARNRLIAALSEGILVTEAAEDSGSLVTAEWGFTLLKKVFAVPGPINSHMARGSLKLLKQGARLVTEGDDVMEEFKTNNLKIRTTINEFVNLSKEEKKIVEILQNEDMTVDSLSKKVKMKNIFVTSLVSGLELKGLVTIKGGKIYITL